jgi:predicted metal-dependent hydrolase
MDVSPSNPPPPAPRPRTIKPRAVRFDFDHVPRHWFGGSVIASHLVNGINLLFPAGERFFVRSVRRYVDRIEDPALREQVRAFSGQEGRHANAHEKYFEALERQGYRIRGFLRFYEAFNYRFLERILPPELRLSITVAAEHFTATLGRNGLEDDPFANADPVMRELLMWHAAEEIEHKAVAFDVLKEVNPSYALRMAGLAFAGTLLGAFWVSAMAILVVQDGAGLPRVLNELRELGGDNPFGERVYGAAIRSYVRRDFHPDEVTRDAELAHAYLESAGIA